MSFLEINGVRKTFGQSVAVEHFELRAERGEFVSFLGPSGCGKTTTLRMVAGFERPSAGHIRIDGVDMTDTPPNKRKIGMVFQSYALFPNMTVADNIGFGMRVAGRPRAEIRARVDEMLGLIHMPEFARRYPAQLSGGQQQRVALARALAAQPQLLLLDEPLSALDAKIRLSLRQEIRAIQRQLNITTIYVTHDQEEAMSLSDRIVVMNRGRIEQIGGPFEVYNFPQTGFVASFVGTLNVLPAEVVDAGAGRVRVDGQEIALGKPISGGAAGQRLSVAVRPEIISPNGAHGPQANQLRGSVEDVTFLGAIVRVRVRLGASAVHFDVFNNPHLAPPAHGDLVTLRFPAESCMVITEARNH
ncbi:ABC transporter ATP-binding protein [Oscillochloris sp. ZM17-4]|uniref:ABC transporter ATP-binding protein n=1 Tax=Oscillochloris sp. ZM17-4 TaxID=2866714 RepID=UPI001C73B496|nr:ABC transporter ATP-binding protein [Oscillochloris sp. ZM17-4]MBX0326993.1 ABC transporter ATP-binding protein [Oscillochloris sp. ZM17-4]